MSTDLILQPLLRGDPEAIDAWYRREHPEVYRLCFGFLAEAHEADDAAQDAMLRILDRLPSYDPDRGYRAWRNTVVLNLCRDRLRRRGARARATEGAMRAGPTFAQPAALPGPEDAAQAAEVRAILASALTALSPREREAFVLRDLQGESTADAAEALGISPSSVRSLLTLARRRLRNLLGPRLVGLVPGAGASPEADR